MKKYTQYVVLEMCNSFTYLDKFVSNKPITIEKVAEYYKEKCDFNDKDDDDFIFVADPTEIKI